LSFGEGQFLVYLVQFNLDAKSVRGSHAPEDTRHFMQERPYLSLKLCHDVQHDARPRECFYEFDEFVDHWHPW
jgi:hypothetical protein